MVKSVEPTEGSIKDTLGNFRRLLPYLWRHSGILAVGLTGMMIGIAMNFSAGLLIRYAIDSFPDDPAEATTFLNNALIFSLLYVLVKGITDYITGYNFRLIAANITRNLRCDIFQSLVNRDLAYLDRQSSGDIQTRVVADTGEVGSFLANQMPAVLAGGVSMIVGVAGALFVSPKLALIVLAALPFIFVPLVVFGARLRVLGRSVQAAIAQTGTFAGEIFRNIKVVRAYNKEERESRQFAEYSDQVLENQLRTARLELGMSVIVNAIAMFGFAVLLWSAGKDILSATITVGTLVAFAYFALMIVQSGARFLHLGAEINVIVGKGVKLLEYLTSEEHAEPSNVGVLDGPGQIQFRGVNFSYPSRPSVRALRNASLIVPAGVHVALVGSSGAGKSTMLELLIGLYRSFDGEILVDGIDIRSLNADQLRSVIGYVPQKESLVTGTVKENIGYGTEDPTDEEVIAAATLAYADEFIQDLPDGYDTDLGEVGSQLSGGQKQRIALARALIRDPKILLLDEAKSALDAGSERLVAEAIRNWATRRKATVISVAHRLSAILNAELIGVIENGAIIDQGQHDELLKRCRLYQKLSSFDVQSTQVGATEADVH